MIRPRISLRCLLLLTAAVAAFCWYRDLPRQNANQFANLIGAGDYRAVEAMFYEDHPTTDYHPRLFHSWKITQLGQSTTDWLCGRYRLTVAGDLHGCPTGGCSTYTLALESRAMGVRRIRKWRLSYMTPFPVDERLAKLSRSEAVAIAEKMAGAELRPHRTHQVDFLEFNDGARKWVVHYAPDRFPGDSVTIFVNDADRSTNWFHNPRPLE